MDNMMELTYSKLLPNFIVYYIYQFGEYIRRKKDIKKLWF